MRIILLRHGEAVTAQEVGGLDDARHLTLVGRRQATEAGGWLASRSELAPGRVWTSTLVRAVQTAELAVAAWGAAGQVEARRDLAVHDNASLLQALHGARAAKTVLLVGHLPQMGDLARLLSGSADVPSPTTGTVIVLQGRPQPGGCEVAARWNGR